MREPFWLIALVLLMICSIVAAVTFPVASKLEEKAKALQVDRSMGILTLKITPAILFVFGLLVFWILGRQSPDCPKCGQRMFLAPGKMPTEREWRCQCGCYQPLE